MGIKKYLEAVFDPNQDSQTRLFMQPTLVLLIAELVMFLFSLLDKSVPTKVVLGVGFLLTAVIAQLSYNHKKMSIGSAVIATLITFGILPVTFFSTGGISGGVPIWFVAFVLYISLVMSGRQRIAFIIAISMVAGFCYYFAYSDPSLMTQQTINQSYRSSLLALVLVGFSFGGSVSFALRTYQEEIDRSEERGREIEKLNKAQNQFFSNVSHEIRTPINTIIGLNEMILREKGISDEVAEDAMNIRLQALARHARASRHGVKWKGSAQKDAGDAVPPDLHGSHDAGDGRYRMSARDPQAGRRSLPRDACRCADGERGQRYAGAIRQGGL